MYIVYTVVAYTLHILPLYTMHVNILKLFRHDLTHYLSSPVAQVWFDLKEEKNLQEIRSGPYTLT